MSNYKGRVLELCAQRKIQAPPEATFMNFGADHMPSFEAFVSYMGHNFHSNRHAQKKQSEQELFSLIHEFLERTSQIPIVHLVDSAALATKRGIAYIILQRTGKTTPSWQPFNEDALEQLAINHITYFDARDSFNLGALIGWLYAMRPQIELQVTLSGGEIAGLLRGDRP